MKKGTEKWFGGKHIGEIIWWKHFDWKVNWLEQLFRKTNIWWQEWVEKIVFKWKWWWNDICLKHWKSKGISNFVETIM